ncbi:hypothetical protein A2Y85_04575 [candidate division WOR-3 bacterium RBG_13_43_14]|uniref:Uncharacterized protein n=1 Tax=candidate division WOR-3 bacterium RBG_13_43_14 TaxID=1802590 RepID=A0A1F4UFS4_UNCW3|nr:MAG: hypothetical protein A2Y85_04575 [candidate division WOR-3 bacterium RBG_13_43_14]
MKKLFAIAIAVGLMSGLYALNLGLGVAYESVDNDARYLAIKADARVPLFAMIDVRGELLNVSLAEGGKVIHFGTFTGSDLLIKFPMPSSIKPYLCLGVWFNKGLEDAPLDFTNLALKAGLGAEMGFGGLNAYLEGGLNKFTWVDGADPATDQQIYVQLGATFPLGM